MIGRVLAVALTLLAPAAALAHGEHGAGEAVGQTGAVTLGGYRVELLSHPSPLAAGREHHLTARITTEAGSDPAPGGRVLVALAEPGVGPVPVPAAELTWAGRYTAAVTPTRRGPATVRVVLEELDGRHIHPPLVVDFPVTVAAVPGPGVGVWALVALVTGVAAVVLYGIGLRARLLRPGEAALDWLDVPGVRRSLTSPAFQPALQLPTLALTGIVVALDRNTYCTLCARCVAGCDRGNLVLRLRAFGKDLWASGRRALDEAYLAVALVGLTLVVTAQMLTAWPDWISALARWLPAGVRAGMKPVTYLGALESAVLLGAGLVAGPLLVLGGAALADRLAGARGLGLRRTFVTFGYMFVPVGLAMHLAHNLAHLLLEGGGIIPVVQRAVALYTPLRLGAPDWSAAPLAPEAVVTVFQMAILVGFFGHSLLAGHRLALRVYGEPRTAARALVPPAALCLLFTLAGILLLNQSMGMRHGT